MSLAVVAAPHRAYQSDCRRGERHRAPQDSEIPKKLRLSGLETLNIGDDSLFRTLANAPTSLVARIRPAILNDNCGSAERGAVRWRTADHRHQHGRSDADCKSHGDLNLIAAEPIFAAPIMLDSSKWSVISRSEMHPRQVDHQLISMKEGEEEFIHHAKLARRYGAAGDRDGV